MYLLPKEHPATKKILESPTNIPCDIYTENSGESVKQQIDDFMKFVESHLNKVRKSHIQRSTTRVSFICAYREKRIIYPYPPPLLICSTAQKRKLLFFNFIRFKINPSKYL